ncbi:MAG: HAD-IIB family hydrolase [Acidobacteriaceae bacterium]|nr:HAD-IIB family hydrolase [Acidobacteriaceae bacterium]MBV9781002.1 HAD-IIB family hydrolase [Acidobacteriaceae bacterium]
MRYVVLACDYDGTLATDGRVEGETVRALERLAHSGRKLILVTGRELPDLESVFSRLDLFERVVAENGALLYNPATREKRTLAPRPPERFMDDLRKRGISNMSAGEVIVATWRPHERKVMEAIRDFGLELQIIFNKDAVMILPSGVNKMTGLGEALQELKLSRHNAVGIGDAENDHAFLESCECSVAVANAIPSLKEKASLVTKGARGAGVVELINKLVQNDLSDLHTAADENGLLLGKTDEGNVTFSYQGRNILVCGQSGSGKSTLVTGLLERISAAEYQICLIDPEGDYENLPGFRTIGNEKHAPYVNEIVQVLEEPQTQVVINLVAVSAADRPDCFSSVMTTLQELCVRTGRPHWLVIDEAHHVLPSEWAPASSELAGELSSFMLITVHPGHVSSLALKKVDTVIVVGREPAKTLAEFAMKAEKEVPRAPERDLDRGEALLWFRDGNRLLPVVKVEPSRTQHDRHKRKYAEGELEPERVFHFRGPEGKLDLRAQNLNLFVQLAKGVDTDTWMFHLKRGDYSNWLRHCLKDTELAEEIERIEQDQELPEKESRERVTQAISRKYTAPA